MSVILNPVEQYFDLDGEPLQSGYIYFGEVYGNPVTQPTIVYFDPEFTIPAAQPIRTVNGFPVRSGTATGLYAPDDVSILVQNSKREQVIYIQSSAINTGDTTTVYRTANASLTPDDNNRTFIALSAFTQTFDPAVNLGDRWRVNIINMSSGNVILDPNLAETIDGQSTLTLTPNQTLTVYSNGVNLFTNLVSIKLVPDDAYNATTWNGSLEVPTKNAIRDKIESLPIPALETNASDPTWASVSATIAATPQWIVGLLDAKVFGFGDAWVDYTATKNQNILYTNSGTKLRKVMGYLNCTTANNFQVQIDTFTMSFDSVPIGGVRTFAFEVPPGSTYLVNPGGLNFNVGKWWELG